MDTNSEMQSNREALMRIVALLIALAALAERASSLAAPVRCLVLWILGPAEATACEFVEEAALQPAPALFDIAALDGGSTDAIRLALRFRALAAALTEQLAQTSGIAMRPSNAGEWFHCDLHAACVAEAVDRKPYALHYPVLDTS